METTFKALLKKENQKDMAPTSGEMVLSILENSGRASGKEMARYPKLICNMRDPSRMRRLMGRGNSLYGTGTTTLGTS